MKNELKCRILLFGILFLFVSTSIHAQHFGFDPPPKWVKTIDTPEKSPISKYEIMSGFYTTLMDYQSNLEENTMFCHEVKNVVSYSGITSASQLSVSFDSSYQKLIIHHLYILRKGNKIDRTKDLSLEIMNNEQELQQGIYTGRVIAYDILNDIRKDDLIDFAYSLVGKNPIFEDSKFLFIPLESMNPIDLFSLRVLYHKERNYSYRCSGCDSLISVTEFDGFHQIEIQNINVKAMKYEDNVPTWTIPFKYFLLSSFKSWKDVNLWAQNVFALKKNPDLNDVFDEIFTGKETSSEKINKIINYVQDDIRYMGVESGIGSIKPLSPELVVKQRFGDCKDKSLLLVSLLKKIGIEKAFPALVNTDMQQEIEKLGPSSEIFNHCIVTFSYNDTAYWVDPSIPMQGGDFRDLNYFHYAKALIIGQPSDTLQNMSAQNTESLADIVDEFTINSFTEPAQLHIVSKRYGFEADSRRALIEFYTPGKLLEETIKETKLQFPIVNKTAELKVDDDLEKNIFTLTYNFEVDGFWQDGDKGTNADAKGLWIFRFEPQMLYQDLNISACKNREFDFAQLYPMNLNYTVIFHLPKTLIIDDDYEMYDNAAFFYEEKIEQLSSDSFQLVYKIRTKSNFIKACDFEKVCEQKNTIAKKIPIIIYFPK